MKFNILLMPCVIVVLSFLILGLAQAAIIHVPTDYPTIQQGIDAAENDDTVLAADGIYKGIMNTNLDYKGKAIVVTSENGAKSTIIDCENEGRGVYFHSGETKKAILRGFTIANGASVDTYRGAICCMNSSSPTIENNIVIENNGCGIYCHNSSPIIQNNRLYSNRSKYSGGGICCVNFSSPNIQNNRLINNSTDDSGGGIFYTNSALQIVGNTINHNTASTRGGGICGWDTFDKQSFIIDNIIDGNSANYEGGGIRLHYATVDLISNLIINNNAENGAGIYCSYISKPQIVNCTIGKNTANKSGGGINYSGGSTSTLVNTIIWENKPNGIDIDIISSINASYSNIQEGCPGEGNINTDPLFTDAENGNYHLKDSSPCIGSGIMADDVPAMDLDGIPRPYPPGSKPDMGAYEYLSGNNVTPMVLIPSGSFIMGCDEDCSIFQFQCEDSKPAHVVYLDAFYIDKYEVNNAQYKRFIDATGYREPKYWDDPVFNAPSQPVVGVNWYDAKAYADWAGKRLPTEAEWEKAARGGLVGLTYPWKGDINCDYDNFGGCSYQPTPVGTHIPNGYGLYEIGANVREWCEDYYDPNYYEVSPKDNPKGPDSGNSRVVRGGSYENNGDHMLTHVRIHASDPSIINSAVGFRCAKDIQVSEVETTLEPGWNMISFPGALKDPSIESLISQNSSIIPPLYTYDPTTFSYKEVTEVKPGESYWILSLAGGSLKADYIPISSMLLNLKPGWNMIGSVNGPVDFSNPQDVPDDSVIYPIYTYNPVSFGYEEKTIIESKMGYWVLALQECTVTLSTNAAPAKKNTTKPSRTTVPDWTVIIQINASKYSKELSLGVQSGASDGFDPYIDKATPPSPGISSKRAEASFEIEDRVVKHLNRDIKNDKNLVWKMRIDSPMDDVELSWDSSSIHLEKDLCIQYESSEINMRSEKSIKIPSGNHILTIILKDRIPTKPELLQNYPNPFNPETWIPYHLSEDSNVYIRIYNSSGYLVRTLDLGYRLAGYYRSKDKAAYWDGDNETGEKVSSGVYFYTIQAGKYTDTKKMVILR